MVRFPDFSIFTSILAPGRSESSTRWRAYRSAVSEFSPGVSGNYGFAPSPLIALLSLLPVSHLQKTHKLNTLLPMKAFSLPWLFLSLDIQLDLLASSKPKMAFTNHLCLKNLVSNFSDCLPCLILLAPVNFVISS